MGITIHQINNKVDLGIQIHHSKTKIYEGDSIIDLAYRHYRNEVNTLCEYILGSLKCENFEDLKFKDSRMRMNTEKEKVMLEKFNDYKNWMING